MTEQLNKILGIHHIRTTAFNPKVNDTIKRPHISFKARQKYWMTNFFIILLG